MKIIEFRQNVPDNSFTLKGLVSEYEFRHLVGFTDRICLFAPQTVSESTKVTMTGARHSSAKWMLLPASLRTKFEKEEYNYDDVNVGFVEYKKCVYIIYRLDKTGCVNEDERKNENI